MKKKILLVGDLRPAMNFGAIATTQSLIDLVETECELSTIDLRSFRGRSPKEGFDEFKMPFRKFAEGDPKSKVLRSKASKLLKTTLATIGLSRYMDFAPQIPSSLSEFKKQKDRFDRDLTWLPFERRLLEEADAVVINAEGSIVHNIHASKSGRYRLGARYMLFLAYLAKVYFRKPTAIVNHIVDPDDKKFEEVIQEVYSRVDKIAVRDRASKSNLQSIGISGAQFIPDALFSKAVNEDCLETFMGWREISKFDKYVVLGDSAAISYVKWNRVDFYKTLVDGLRGRGLGVVFVDGRTSASSELEVMCKQLEVPRISVFNTRFQELGAVLSKSEAFFSGRWHASILATMAGCPSILFGTDSHKTAELHTMVGNSGPFFDIERLPNQIDEVINSIELSVAEGQSRRERLLKLAEDYRVQTDGYKTIVRDL